ncbi:unnamed protein product [Prorocentrum cordatum]|uniref:Uncharacterized protein n=1 Tax=Prorocentrum cordatum TaxID=2364126 RepID=A0ABN9VF23_9DINO|nr:unnamed protein product [Polarella glacialis]
MESPTLADDLRDIVERYNIPPPAQALLSQKNVLSAVAIARTFEDDDDQFAEFLLDGSTMNTRRLRLALKMVFYDAVQLTRDSGQAACPAGGSPEPSEASEPEEAPEPSEDEGEEEEGSSDDDAEPQEAAAAAAAAPAPEPGGPGWRF